MFETREMDKFIQEQVLHLAFIQWVSPYYSTDDVAAMDLINKLQDMGHMCVYRFDGLRESMRYTAMINQGPRVDAEKLSIAIAQAVCQHFGRKNSEQG